MKSRTKKKHITQIIIISIVVLALIAGVTVYALTGFGKKSAPNSTTTSQSSKNNSSQQSTPSNTDTDGNAKTSTSSATPTQSTSNASVVIVDASQYSDVVEVRAYADVIQDGTCTYNFTKGGATITKQSPATKGASTSSCATLDVPTTEFSNGTWQVTVSFASTSNTVTGTSPSKAIIVNQAS